MKVLTAALALACALTMTARAQADYDLAAEPWNGLGYLLITAAEARVEVDTPPTIELDALTNEEVLFIVYPRAPLPVDDLLAFARTGGTLIVADDRGEAAPLFAAAGLTRRDEGPTHHTSVWADQRGFERLSPQGEHFLFYNVDAVVTNHPAALTLTRDAAPPRIPVLSFEGGAEHLIVEVTLGPGKLLAIADPSLFLNDMLRRFYGNKQLAANLLRYPCLSEPCRITLVPPGRTYEGRFDPERARLGAVMSDIADLVAGLNQLVAEASTGLASPSRVRWVIAALLVMCAVLAYRVQLRGRRRVPELLRPLARTTSSPMLDEVRGLIAQSHEGDFAALAPPLAQAGVELARRHRLHEVARRPEAPPGPADPADEALRAALLRIESEAVGLRAREPSVWSAERLIRLHEDVETLRHTVARLHTHRRGERSPQGVPPT